MNLCLPACEDDSQCRRFGGYMSMKCHKLYNEKTNICGMPCREDIDCVDDNAKCSDSRCVPLNEPDETDTETDDAGDTVSDEEPADDSDDDMNLDDDQPAKKKKSGGCAITTL
jgi:hypothetical protein